MSKQIPLEIKLTLKKCPICGTWMEGESSQEISPWYIEFGKRVTNKNTIKCPNCRYTEIHTQIYSENAVRLILHEQFSKEGEKKLLAALASLKTEECKPFIPVTKKTVVDDDSEKKGKK